MKKLSLFLLTLLLSCIQNVNYNHIFEPMPGFLFYGINQMKDRTPPEFSFTAPYPFESGYSRNRAVLVVYDKPISTSSVGEDTLRVYAGEERIAGKIKVNKNSIQFLPDKPYQSHTQYKVVLQNTVADLNGNKQAVFKEESVEFTTGNDIDLENPILKNTTPTNDTTDVALNTAINLVFNENISPETVTDESIVLKQGDSVVSKTIQYYGSVIQIKPTTSFQSFTKYTIVVANSIQDLAGNSLATEQTISFTTNDTSDRTPPFVESVIPLDNSVDVSNNTLVVSNISENIDVLSFNQKAYFVEEIGSNGSIARADGSISMDGKILSFRIKESFRTNAKHRVTLRGSISDLSGNSMGTDKVYHFTTGRLITYIVGGSVSGLNGTLILQNNGTNDTTISTNGSFAFSSPVANTYYVTIKEQPVGQTCSITNGNGTSTSNITNINITCKTASYTIGGLVGGLTSGETVSLLNNDASISITENTSFTFPVVNYNTTYNVTVSSAPSGKTCTVYNGTGSATSNIINISVSCASVYTPGVQNFTDNRDGTITDKNTKLVWMKCSMSEVPGVPLAGDCSYPANTSTQLETEIGQYKYCRESDSDCNGGTKTGTYGSLVTSGFLGTYVGSYGTVYNNDFSGDHYIAYKVCDAANSVAGSRTSGSFAGKTNWRVPTIAELETLVDKTISYPAINSSFFPNTFTSFYWSSTTFAASNSFAWYVDFGLGNVYNSLKTSNSYIRCVSGP